MLQFQNLPPKPPSTSELDKLDEKEPPFLESVQKFFKTPGFTLPLAAFICSISITNIVGVSSEVSHAVECNASNSILLSSLSTF
jgi:hypothetical protein